MAGFAAHPPAPHGLPAVALFIPSKGREVNLPHLVRLVPPHHSHSAVNTIVAVEADSTNRGGSRQTQIVLPFLGDASRPREPRERFRGLRGNILKPRRAPNRVLSNR